MLLRLAIVRLGSAACLAAGFALPAWAERIVVSPGEADLQAVLDRAAEGDVIVLRSGEHRAQLRIARRLTLEGEPGAVVLGPGKGNVITVSAPDAVVRGLVVRGSGRDLERMDSGVFIEKTASARRRRGQQDRGQPLRRLHPRCAGGGRPRGTRSRACATAA